jgi:sialate O-acetylesterase
MRVSAMLKSLGTILLLLCFVAAASGDVGLPSIFGDHMVLQRDMPAPVWGWADPAEEVTVTIAGQSKTTTASIAGKGSVKLEAIKAGGPYELVVKGKNTVEFSDVLVGEVWLGSGQSNMEMRVDSVANKDAEMAAADLPQIRMYTAAKKTALEPQQDCQGSWQVCSPATVGRFSATAYFFGRELHKELKVPVGLIHSSWGGTPIQGWISQKTQESVPELAPGVESFKKAAAAYDAEAATKQHEKALADWEKARVEAKDDAERRELGRRRPARAQNPIGLPSSPGRLFNGMIAPLAPYAVRGMLWYQGESNAGQVIYGLQMRTLIAEWRALWGEGDFPFLFVQLPNYLAPQTKPSEPVGGWMRTREQFLQTLAVPNTGMAITIDIGEAKDLHPKNKQEVGRRLAQWALAKTYGKDVVASGPLYKSMRKDGNKIVIEFDYVDGGLAAREGDKLTGFAIAGLDKKFVWGDAQIVGQTVVVSSPEVPSPASVRYAWAHNPECNLVNKAGLPASPFRTDDWNE